MVLYELSNLLEDKEFISIEDAVDGEKGLSNIYQLTGIVANELLDKLDTLDYIRINRTAGLDVIYKNSQFTATSVVEDYYKNKR